VPGHLEIIVNQGVGAGVQRQIPRFFALAGDLDMQDAAACLIEVADFELAELFPAKRVIKQRRQNCAIALAFDGLLIGRN
jgi:hypothetical protein